MTKTPREFIIKVEKPLHECISPYSFVSVIDANSSGIMPFDMDAEYIIVREVFNETQEEKNARRKREVRSTRK